MLASNKNSFNTLKKTPTGISGLDEITEGGFPQGRPILVCGSAGCGKTLMGIQFLVKGITELNEPGVLMTFEESAADLTRNVQSLGFDLDKLIKEKKLRIDHVKLERSEIEETGEFDLEGLFVRLNHAIDSIGAKRVVLDTIESLFSGIDNSGILRSEIRRLFTWLKTKGVTTIITGEKGNKTLTRQGLEEYVSDCVILLDFRIIDQIATRRLRIVKYRGSTHGTNEYPFLIDQKGISVLPITSLKLDHKASTEVISTGIIELDNLFKSGGLYRGNSTLVTGSAGTAKTILASYFALSSCQRNEKVVFFSFEESPDQLVRNMGSVGIKLKAYVNSGLLIIHSTRPTMHGLELHLLSLHNYLIEFKPRTVIIDPISSLFSVGSNSEVKAMLVRLLDVLKRNQINAMFTSLTPKNTDNSDATQEVVSSLADTWINLRNQEFNHTVIRNLMIIKSRGMGHSGSLNDFIITDKGLRFMGSHAEESQSGKNVKLNSSEEKRIITKKTSSKSKLKQG